MLAQNSPLWNPTGGGSSVRRPDGIIVHAGTVMPGRKVGLGDAGKRFRSGWPEVDVANWKWIDSIKIDIMTGGIPVAAEAEDQAVVRRRAAPTVGILASGGPGPGATGGEGWSRRHRLMVGANGGGTLRVATAFEKGTAT